MLATKLSFLIFSALLHQTIQLCQNTTDNRYNNKNPIELTNYYSTCSSFTKRTCCSPKNIDNLIKKFLFFLFRIRKNT